MPPAVLLRCVAGGVLAGLASLVPGVSAGTMILATGIYPRIVSAAAEVVGLRFRRASVLPLAVVVGTAAFLVVLLAGTVRDLFLAWPAPLFSLFAGLTLGGVPLLWAMGGPRRSPAFFAGAAGGLLAAALPSLLAAPPPAGATGVEASAGALLLGGAAAAFAMVLPGISGSYLLLLLGLYLPFLHSVDAVRQAVGRGAPAPEFAAAALGIAPFAVGAALGIALAARLVRHFLERSRQPALGALLGLLLGAVIGLYPFRSVAGERFSPEPADLVTAALFALIGFVLAYALGRATGRGRGSGREADRRGDPGPEDSPSERTNAEFPPAERNPAPRSGAPPRRSVPERTRTTP